MIRIDRGKMSSELRFLKQPGEFALWLTLAIVMFGGATYVIYVASSGSFGVNRWTVIGVYALWFAAGALVLFRRRRAEVFHRDLNSLLRDHDYAVCFHCLCGLNFKEASTGQCPKCKAPYQIDKLRNTWNEAGYSNKEGE